MADNVHYFALYYVAIETQPDLMTEVCRVVRVRSVSPDRIHDGVRYQVFNFDDVREAARCREIFRGRWLRPRS